MCDILLGKAHPSRPDIEKLYEEATMLYQPTAPGDWGQMQPAADIVTATEELATEDACKLFLRSWKTHSSQALLILHGLGGPNGWYSVMVTLLTTPSITVNAMEHRGFDASGGM